MISEAGNHAGKYLFYDAQILHQNSLICLQYFVSIMLQLAIESTIILIGWLKMFTFHLAVLNYLEWYA